MHPTPSTGGDLVEPVLHPGREVVVDERRKLLL